MINEENVARLLADVGKDGLPNFLRRPKQKEKTNERPATTPPRPKQLPETHLTRTGARVRLTKRAKRVK